MAKPRVYKGMIHLADQLRKVAKDMSNTRTSVVFEGFTIVFAEEVRERLLLGVAKGYDINVRQFKRHSKVTTWVRANPKGKLKQFGGSSPFDDDEAIRQAYELEGMVQQSTGSSGTKTTVPIGDYTFSPDPNGSILYGGSDIKGSIPAIIGDHVEGSEGGGRYESQVVVPGKTVIKIKQQGVKAYQLAHNTNSTIPPSKFSEKFNTVGKSVPKREWLGIPKLIGKIIQVGISKCVS